MKKSMLTKGLVAAGTAVAAVPFLFAGTVSAGAYDYYNRSDSSRSIYVYEKTACAGTRHTVYPGGRYGNGRSYRVNAPSKFKIGSGSYKPTVNPNVCVTWIASETITVYVYPLD